MDELNSYIEKLIPAVTDLFWGDSSGHDTSHSIRTMKAALYLQEHEGGDRVVVALASLLHDAHRAMERDLKTFVSPADSLTLVRELLAPLGLTQDRIEAICYCVEHHEDYSWNGDVVDDLNALIVQDADNLEAVGAMGIARAFAYSGAHGMCLYDPAVPLNEDDDYSEFDGDEPSAIHHFHHKLFKLASTMNTPTAKTLAEERIDYMRAFVDRFVAEWNGDL